MTIRTVIVDDEPLARRKLRSLLESEGDIEVIAESGNGQEALQLIEETVPHLLFLDIEMPGLNGLAVVEKIEPSRMPATVFVTAYEQFAVQAFEIHAVDYLLKPFSRARFRKALHQVRGQIESRNSAELTSKVSALLDDLRKRDAYVNRFAVKSSGRLYFLRAEDIEWVDAAGNYVRLNAGGEAYQLRETMSSLEKQLDPDRFLRIHRSTIVNIERIREIRPLQHGEHVVVLKNGQRLNLSRGYRDRLAALLN